MADRKKKSSGKLITENAKKNSQNKQTVRCQNKETIKEKHFKSIHDFFISSDRKEVAPEGRRKAQQRDARSSREEGNGS
ncbi:hypothetical protein KFK09_008354 [Dendrobium nobile]|uniref:Uncharacterized protein n=1 Tax=Dendrobium nobile TaxID=94219 RepID=A0A8T3BMH8_DENNO|nr:hypothetical protein KFK09_008354 [Dendrobium nobile]